jgi:hypothetical protein
MSATVADDTMAIPGVIPAMPLAATVMPVSEVVKGLLKLLV